MIYLRNTTTAQTAFIPKELKGTGGLSLTIVSTLDMVAYVDGQAVSDTGFFSLYYRISVALPEGMPDGEYEYTLKDGNGAVLASGVLKVGEQTGTTEEYNSEVIYEQYESE